MAQARKVKVGQIYRDSQGRQLEVVELQGDDGKFKVRNLETGRSLRRGARALTTLERDVASHNPDPAPAPRRQATPRPRPRRGGGGGQRPLTPAQIAAGFGGKRAQRAQAPGARLPTQEEYLHGYPPGYGATTGQAPPRMPVREEGPPPSYTVPPPPRPAPNPYGGPDTPQAPLHPELVDVIQHAAPSPMVAHLILRLLAIPPDKGQNTILVDKVFARAKTEWKTRMRRY